ncbi:MAG: molybdate ABC transporter substrate-binding protein [Actinomycetota bacterium]
MVLTTAVSAAVAAAACGGDPNDRALRVFAAASLTEAFDELAIAFEAAEPDHRVQLVVAGSATLRDQVLAGAPADVVAFANEAVMADLVAAEVVEAPVDFATNRLTLAVPADNPGAVAGLDDLGRPELFVGLCATGVPCGDLAQDVLAAADIEAAVDTFEPSVRAVLTKLAERELDAGLVYSTDVAAEPSVRAVELPDGTDAVTRYPIAAVLRDADQQPAARRFIDFVTGPEGQATLAGFGFGRP